MLVSARHSRFETPSLLASILAAMGYWVFWTSLAVSVFSTHISNEVASAPNSNSMPAGPATSCSQFWATECCAGWNAYAISQVSALASLVTSPLLPPFAMESKSRVELHAAFSVLIASIRLLFTAPTSFDPYATCITWSPIAP